MNTKRPLRPIISGAVLVLGVISAFLLKESEHFDGGSESRQLCQQTESEISEKQRRPPASAPTQPSTEIPRDQADDKVGAVVASNGPETDSQSRNHRDLPSDRDSSPLDVLANSSTLSELWIEGPPDIPGWHRRVRIVNADFKISRLRIVEDVLLERKQGRLTEIGSLVVRAAAADYVLMGSAGISEAPDTIDYSFQPGNRDVVKVKVPDPALPESLPAFISHLRENLRLEPEEDQLFYPSSLPVDPWVGSGYSWHIENLGLLPGHMANADIQAESAWAIRSSAPNSLIALIDSGINHSDPEITPSLHQFGGETLGDNIDNDGNGYVDDVMGYDFYEQDATPAVARGHGHSCAQLIAGEANNNIASSGVTWRARILDCRIFGPNNLALVSDAVDAIDYARSSGAKIINLSWGYFGSAPVLEQALLRASADGIIIVTASGNEGNRYGLPAPARLAIPGKVVVAASTPDDKIATFSNVDGNLVDLAAPGVALPVIQETQMEYVSGTSFSAAIVTGALALGIEQFPGESAGRLIERLLATTDPIPASRTASGGRLNLSRFLGTPGLAIRNDTFSQRSIFRTGEGSWAGTNADATLETVDFGVTPQPTRSLWFEWVSPSSGFAQFSISAPSEAGGSLSVFKKDLLGMPGMRVAAGSDRFEIEVEEGDEYLILLDSLQPVSTRIGFSWSVPPANDLLDDAGALSGLPLSIQGSTYGATSEEFEQGSSHHLYHGRASLWWRWTPGYAGTVQLLASPQHEVFLYEPITALPGQVVGDVPGAPPGYRLVSDGASRAVLEDEMEYLLLVVPQSESTRGGFVLTAHSGDTIQILNQPDHVEALPGETVKLSIEATSAAPLSYQWFKDGELVPFATYPTLSFQPVNPRTFGDYHVVVSNEFTEVVSEVVSVAPRNAPPRLVSSSQRTNLVLGQSVVLRAEFRAASDIAYQWFKDGQIMPGFNSPEFALSQVTVDDAATYRLVATSAGRSRWVDIVVGVDSTPWNGWVERTPGSIGRSPVISTRWLGNQAHAITQNEWLVSDNDGESWANEPVPGGIRINEARILENGRRLIYGYEIEFNQSSVYFVKDPGGEWVRIQPINDAGQNISIGGIEVFAGRFWARSGGWAGGLVSSLDGREWVQFSFEGEAVSLRDAVSFGSCMVVTTFSPFTLVVWPDGAVQKLQGNLWDCIHVPSGLYISTDKVKGFIGGNRQLVPVTEVPNIGLFAYGQMNGDRFDLLNSDREQGKELRTVWRNLSITSRRIGYSASAYNGQKWIIGYLDGSLYIGDSLAGAPRIPLSSEPRASYNVLDHEILADTSNGLMHSSDGIRWNRLAVMGGSPVDEFEGTFLAPSIIPPSSLTSPLWEVASAVYARAGTSSSTVIAGRPQLDSPYGLCLRVPKNGSSIDFDLQLHRRTGGGIQVTPVPTPRGVGSSTKADILGGKWFIHFDQYPASSFVADSLGQWRSLESLGASVFSFKDNQFIAIQSPTLGFRSSNSVSWVPFVPTGLTARPSSIFAHAGFYFAKVGVHVMVSADGVHWSVGSPPILTDFITANQHTLFAATNDGRIFQPAGTTSSGPWVNLGAEYSQVTIQRNQSMVYEVTAGDLDGDLSVVELRMNDELIASLAAPPFRFMVPTGVDGNHAIEIAARDATGKVSRATSELIIVATAGGEAVSSNLPSFTKLVSFQGRVFGISSSGVLWTSDDGSNWHVVTTPVRSIRDLVVSNEAIVASTEGGFLTSRDGASWAYHFVKSGFTPHIYFKDGLFHRQEMPLLWIGAVEDYHWVSEDGSSWRIVNEPVRLPSEIWVDDSFGFRVSSNWTQRSAVTFDGGRSWTPVASGSFFPQYQVVEDGILMTSLGGLYRLSRGSIEWQMVRPQIGDTTIADLVKADDRVFHLLPQAFLRSTTDGIVFVEHVPPPNRTPFNLFRHEGQWVAVSEDRISVSSDLQTWSVRHELRSVLGGGNSSRPPSVNRLPDGSVLVGGLGWTTNVLILDSNMDYEWVTPEASFELNRNAHEIATLRAFATGGRILTWSEDDGVWRSNPILAGASYRFHAPGEVVNNVSGNYRQAATDSIFMFLVVGISGQTTVDVIRSVDGLNWIVDTLPILNQGEAIRSFSASDEEFIIGLDSGHVLRSVDGLNWSRHQVVTGFVPDQVLWFSNKWVAVGRTMNSVSTSQPALSRVEVWTSENGLAWARAWHLQTAVHLSEARSFSTAHGVMRFFSGAGQWLRSTDGITWASDPSFQSILAGRNFIPLSEHPEGIFVTTVGSIWVINPDTGNVVRNIRLRFGEEVRWIMGWPHFLVGHQWIPYAEEDPRLTNLVVESGDYGVGDSLLFRISGAEIEEETRIIFALNSGHMLVDSGRFALGVLPWSSGVQVAPGVREFLLPLPPSVEPGSFRASAMLEVPSGAADLNTQNNQIISLDRPVNVPGYELVVQKQGQGRVAANDERQLYPLGAVVHLSAIPAKGHSLVGWSGAISTSSPGIELRMTEDTSLDVVFVPGWRIAIRSVGGGEIVGSAGLDFIEDGKVFQVSSKPAEHWQFSHWAVNGAIIDDPVLTHVASGDAAIFGVFIPDWVAMREAAFGGAPEGIDTEWSADPDSDGYSSFMEIVLGRSPYRREEPLQLQRNAGGMRLAFRRPQTHGVPMAIPEFSDNLTTWSQNAPDQASMRVRPDTDGFETVEITLDPDGAEQSFIRLVFPEIELP